MGSDVATRRRRSARREVRHVSVVSHRARAAPAGRPRLRAPLSAGTPKRSPSRARAHVLRTCPCARRAADARAASAAARRWSSGDRRASLYQCTCRTGLSAARGVGQRASHAALVWRTRPAAQTDRVPRRSRREAARVLCRRPKQPHRRRPLLA